MLLKVLHGALSGVTTTMQIATTGTRGHPVKGVSVYFDARGVGLNRIRHFTTGKHGIATFHGIHPNHPGPILISATKPGYRPAHLTLSIHS
jgi:protocatechuate 3,4-dioxygenase beta subunit